MRALISGGGTGGHINPALAIAEKIKKEEKDSVIEFVGTKKGLETKLIPKEGYEIHYVHVEGIKRKLTLENIKAAAEAVTSVFEARRIIKKFKPDIVIGTGGYVCWPVLRAAAMMNIPTAVHESNAFPGVTTKMLAKYVDRILLNFEESKKYLTAYAKKISVVGNPVKGKMFSLSREECRSKFGIGAEDKFILSYGGSLGAKMINETVFDMISRNMLPKNIYHVHATGNMYWDEAKRRFSAEGFSEKDENTLKKNRIELKRYIYNMPELMACADIVVCRSGAMTVSEVASMGKTAIFIPSPNVTDNHKYKNALVLKNAGAAELIEEKDLTSEKLAGIICKYLSDTSLLRQTGDRAREFAEPKCLDKIYREIESLVAE